MAGEMAAVVAAFEETRARFLAEIDRLRSEIRRQTEGVKIPVVGTVGDGGLVAFEVLRDEVRARHDEDAALDAAASPRERLLCARAQWYRDGCPGLDDGGAYFESGMLLSDVADDLEAALDLLRAARREAHGRA